MTARKILTCLDLAANEVEVKRQVSEDRDSWDIEGFMCDFFRTPGAIDSEDELNRVRLGLYEYKSCYPTNRAEELDCCCECEEPCQSGCPDPDKCPSHVRGVGYTELLEFYLSLAGSPRLPVKDFATLAHGDTLVWDSDAAPENPNCDPCKPDQRGAFVPGGGSASITGVLKMSPFGTAASNPAAANLLASAPNPSFGDIALVNVSGQPRYFVYDGATWAFRF